MANSKITVTLTAAQAYALVWSSGAGEDFLEVEAEENEGRWTRRHADAVSRARRQIVRRYIERWPDRNDLGSM